MTAETSCLVFRYHKSATIGSTSEREELSKTLRFKVCAFLDNSFAYIGGVTMESGKWKVVSRISVSSDLVVDVDVVVAAADFDVSGIRLKVN